VIKACARYERVRKIRILEVATSEAAVAQICSKEVYIFQVSGKQRFCWEK
jgi:hypothetical protein